MSLNFNSNDKPREFYTSELYEDYPAINVTSLNYDTDNLWPEGNNLSISTMRKYDNQNNPSGIFIDDITKSRDDFSTLDYNLKQHNEWKIGNDFGNSPSERTRTVPRQSSAFKDLPVKVQRRRQYITSQHIQPNKSENIFKEQSQSSYTSQMEESANSYKSNLESLSILTKSKMDSISLASSSKEIVTFRKSENESTPQQRFQYNYDYKDDEIARLNKNMKRMNKKVSILENNNKKLQEHLNNLLNERKQLLNEIENSEFEEIIEEEEIQKEKPNGALRENITRFEYVQEASTPLEVSHINCLQRGHVTLEDIPENIFETFRYSILREEREKTEIEKKSLIDSLEIQQRKQLHSMQTEYQTYKKDVHDVSTQSIKMLPYYHYASEANFQDISLQNLIVNSKYLDVPSVANKHCQYDDTQAKDLFKRYRTKSTWSNFQRSMIEKVLKSLENNDYESLLKIFELTFCKLRTSIGINSTPKCSSKSSNTDIVRRIDEMSQANVIIETAKPIIIKENEGVFVKPVAVQRGSQSDDTFKFETGTMTDPKFSRSQGMMTILDYMDYRPPQNFDVDSVIHKSTNLLESHQQIHPHSLYMSSSNNDFIHVNDRMISPKMTKFTKTEPIETYQENVVEVKIMKNEKIPKSINVTEEVEQIVEQKTQQFTSILDNNKVPKKEIPTSIEYWETISHLKDGQVIEESESYHDSQVSTDINTIKDYLDQHDQYQNKDFSPTHKVEQSHLRLSPKLNLKHESLFSTTDGQTRTTSNESKRIQNDSTSSDNFTFIYDYFKKPAEMNEVNIHDKESLNSVIKPTINTSESSSISFKNKALNSKSSSQDISNSYYISKILKDTKWEYEELHISENIIQYCCQLIVWFKTVNLISTTTISYLPLNLKTVSSELTEWWVDIILKVDALELMKIVKFLVKTFSKMFLKYLFINLDQQGNSCLHYVIGKQLWESYSVLESTSVVNPNIYNSQGYTLLMVACTLKITTDIGYKKFQRLTSVSNVNLKSKIQGQTCIFIAAYHNNSQMIQILCTMGADINIRDNSDITPLMIACYHNHIDAVTTILSWSGVLLDLKNKEGKTASDIAEEAQFSELLEIFKQRKSLKASELSNYSRIVQNSYSGKFYSGTRK